MRSIISGTVIVPPDDTTYAFTFLQVSTSRTTPYRVHSLRWSNHPERQRKWSQHHMFLCHALRNLREHIVPHDNTALAHIHDNTTTTGFVSKMQRVRMLSMNFSTAPYLSRTREITTQRTSHTTSHIMNLHNSSNTWRTRNLSEANNRPRTDPPWIAKKN